MVQSVLINKNEENKRIRREAIQALEYIGDYFPVKVINHFIYVLKNDTDVYCRYRAIRGLKRRKEKAEPAIPILIKIHNEDSRKNIQSITKYTLEILAESLGYKNLNELILKTTSKKE